MDYKHTREDHSRWGRLVENAVGSHLLNNLSGISYRLFYWRQVADEVDLVVQSPHATWAVEVKSGKKNHAAGIEKFRSIFPECRSFIIGQGGMPTEEFFSTNPREICR
jgi:uncharacterized protein